MTGWTAPALVIAAWLVIGAGVGIQLERKGHPSSTAISALVVWPILMSLINTIPTATGPFSEAIQRAFQSLNLTIADPLAADVPWSGELASLHQSLIDADARLAMVDRLLSESDDSDASKGLHKAREHAATELQAVLAGLADLRIQIGLYALEGGEQSVQAELGALQARARALSEVRTTRWTG